MPPSNPMRPDPRSYSVDKKNKRFNYWGMLIFAIGIIIAAFSIIKILNDPQPKETQIAVPVKNEVERAVEVQGIENKFIYVEFRSGFLSMAGAGAGGLGAPQIMAKTAEQFVELIPKNEPVYTAISFGKTAAGYDDPYTMKKTYLSGIENRSMIILYEDIYQYSDVDGGQSRRWQIKNFDNNQVIFMIKEYPGQGLWALAFLGFFMGFIAFIVGLLIFFRV